MDIEKAMSYNSGLKLSQGGTLIKEVASQIGTLQSEVKRLNSIPYSFPEWMGEYPRKCAPWSGAEILLLKKEFENGSTLKQIAQTHGRDEGAIETRLMRDFKTNFFNRDLENMAFNKQQQEILKAKLQMEVLPPWATKEEIELVRLKQSKSDARNYKIGQRVLVQDFIGTILEVVDSWDIKIVIQQPGKLNPISYNYTEVKPLPNGQL